jgi:outer membrane protein OmpA-like peptidoglycan-associated protein/tetratricopeptide (TPR) repeat protein
MNGLISRIFIIIFISLFLVEVYGQDKGEFRKTFLDAEYFFLTEKYEEALYLYSELLKIDPANSNLHFLTGACYLSIYGRKKKAIPYLEEAVLNISAGYREGSYKERNAPREALFALARAYHIDYQLDKAIEYYEKYRNAMIKKNFADIEYVNKQIKSCELARFMIRHPVEVSFHDLSADLDRYTTHYNPVLSGNDSVIIYMADQPLSQAILMSERSSGKWSEPRVINDELESEDGCYPTCLSFNGKELYLVRKDSYEADLFVSRYQNGRWTQMEKLNDHINTEYFESHACISSDGNHLYFTSNRQGGQGGLDIWVSQRSTGGDWQTPENLGPKVNSFYNEETPFITGDAQRLFFSSQGHATMGGYDIFYASRQADATWSYPQNVGYPVSTTDDDLFFVPRHGGERGYFSTILDSVSPNRNIYALVMADMEDIRIGVRKQQPEKIEPSGETEMISQHAEEETAKEEKEASEEELIAEETLAEEVKEEEITEEEAPAVEEEVKKDEGVAGEEEVTVSEEEGAVSEEEGAVSGEAVATQPVSPDEYYVLNSIFFGFDNYTLDEEGMGEADRLVEVMTRYPELEVELTGHSDAVGTDEYNIRLSKRRAESVARYLIDHEIDPDRITTRGVGEAEPLAVNKYEDGSDSPEGRRLNRHVSIRLHNLENENIEVSEIFVPEKLRPKTELSFSVLLLNSDSMIVGMPEELAGEPIALIITDQAYLYTAGNFDRKADAMRLLNEAIDNGFPDATMKEQKELEDMVRDLSDDRLPVSITYTIQIMALKNPVKVSYFRDLGNVMMFVGKDGFHRYVYGEFEEISEALEELPRIRKMGYHDAFIMYLARYKTISSE